MKGKVIVVFIIIFAVIGCFNTITLNQTRNINVQTNKKAKDSATIRQARDIGKVPN